MLTNNIIIHQSDPSFVSSFSYGDRIYFFFRETAVENINCGKVRTYLVSNSLERNGCLSRLLFIFLLFAPSMFFALKASGRYLIMFLVNLFCYF